MTTSVDLWRGATATQANMIVAVYLGVSLAFGKNMINWADEKFRYYVLKEDSKSVKKYGMEHTNMISEAGFVILLSLS
ncbi:hypothetical protein [Bacillus sp. Hm123]|uniref:hypothetical protein n=1 Tax=Bacillus sp. Hm123 TaxID=3450745 RepID=UPI003F4383BE